MQQHTSYRLKRKNILIIAAILGVTLTVLLFANYQNIYSYQDMAEDVNASLIRDTNIDATLMTYRDAPNGVELTVTLNNLNSPLSSYKNDAIRFVCDHRVLKTKIDEQVPVEVTLVATRTKDDKYLKLLIDASQCNGFNN
ncbi:hypothetical protein KJ365_09120 [Glaciecola sp. XM2]|jgi:hypothetical protein|uniref:hypothetical protein n=1 Tax=Glaciecola sp. XM2 TaxID=1914931 RepID=UPI001BDF2BCF|nr:hypothetical protein [Glaciecola sp. XM2]MBT1451038.1 hypothetical protein [Glaciecola sp. XM2]